MRTRWLVTLACGLCLLLAGCGVVTAQGAPSADADPQTGIMSLHVTRTRAVPPEHLPPFDKNVRDPSTAQRLYAAVQALPAYPPGVYHCPADFNIFYHFTFTRSNGTTVVVLAAPEGCEQVTIGAHDVRRANSAFWSLLAQTFGVSRAQIQPSIDDLYSPASPLLAAPTG